MSGKINSERSATTVEARRRVRLTGALPSCEFYPVHLDLQRRSLGFARIPRATYRKAGFLVPGAADLGKRIYTFNLDDIALSNGIARIEGVRTNYIFISAFCCSTLLARYFDLMPRCLVLREPGLLGQLAIARNRPGLGVPPMAWEQEWREWAALGVSLLTRSFDSRDTVIVKAADVCNNLCDVLLSRDPRSRAVLLSVPLRTFILSVLKSDSRRLWMRARARFWHAESRRDSAIPKVEPDRLDDARRSAFLWMATQALWNPIRRGPSASRVLEVSGDQVANAPRETMRQLGLFFEMDFSDADLDKVAADQTGSRHAKDPRTKYGAADRRRDIEEWEGRFCMEADRAVAWAHSVAPELVA